MSKLTEVARVLRESPDLMRRVQAEAPHAIPLLEAMAVDDDVKAYGMFSSYGDVKDVLEKLPADQRAAVELGGPAFMSLLDAFLPEELLLRAFRFFGVKGGG